MAKVRVKYSCIFAVFTLVLLLGSVDMIAFGPEGELEDQNLLASDDDDQNKYLATRPTSSDVDETAENSITVTSPWEHFRLPEYVIPLHYDLLLHPDVSSDTFTGSVNITVNVTSNTNVFVVHAHGLNIKDSKIFEYRRDAQVGVARSFSYDPQEHFVVETERTAEPGIYKLSYKFFGSLVNSTVGIYRSTYTDQNNQTKNLVISNFQPTYARRAFPCFDEPSFKSTFTISVVHELGYKALSNMPVDNSIPYLDTQLLVTRFQTSMKMATYSACFIICDFDYMRTTSTGKEFRVYAAPDQINKTRYALKFGSRALEYFEKYFGVDYPLPKQDLVAVPDLISDAISHWGIAIFRETNLLYNHESSSLRNKQRISTTIAREMALLWFGNLVTMQWWDDLWLNEGFASYAKYKGVHEQHPKWDLLSLLVTEDMQPVMNVDSAMSSRAIVQPVRDQDEISEMFDDISYKKGASIFRMLEFFIGRDNFQRGISKFLKKYQFKNIQAADLWRELSEIHGNLGNHTIGSVMKTWTEQMGFPFITVRRLHCTENECVFVANQERFVKNETLYRQSWNSSKEYTWSVPLSYVTEHGKTDIVWIHDEVEKEFVVPMEEENWIKFNVNQTGYYLVNYEKEEWDKLIEALMTNHEKFSPLDRANLLFDSFSLATAGQIEFEIPLNMTVYLRNETHHEVWETALKCLDEIKRYFEKDEQTQDIIKEHIRSLAKNLFKKYNWVTSPADYSEKSLRRILIDAACRNGHRDCSITAGDLFNQWKEGVPLDPEIRDLVYIYGSQTLNNEDAWKFLWENYISETDPDVKTDLQRALIRSDTQVVRYMKIAKNESFVKKHDYFPILQSVAQNKPFFSLVTSLIFNEWEDLVKTFGSRDTETLMHSVFKQYDSVDDLNKVREFYKKNKVAKDGQRSRKQTIESILENINWLQRHKARVKEWFENNVYMPWRNIRLPRHIMPTKYNITLHPNITTQAFEGEEEIAIIISEPTNCILVHEEGLKIFHTELKSLKSGETIPIDEKFPFKRNNFYVMNLKEQIPEGEYTLKLSFTGLFNEGRGLKRYQYKHRVDSSVRYLISSKFEPNGARRMFPCFDEPALKATFKLSLIHEDNYTVLSNMPVEVSVPFGENTLTIFEESVKMPTYLFCFVMSDYDYIEREYKGKKIRAYAAPDRIQEAEYGLNLTVKFLKFFEEYFDVPYTLPKLDSVTIPGFISTAMEHWGVITYGETQFLIDEKYTLDDLNIMRVDKVIAHETAHQWFGNLVTMKWWNDIWLNEGISSFMNFLPLQEYYPTIDQIQAVRMTGSMCADSEMRSFPVIRDVHRTPEIEFHARSYLAYKKGRAMTTLLHLISKDDFRKGVSNYLKKYAFKNVESKDLWEEISNASSTELNIAEIMDTWTLQEGFPYVELQRNGDILKATQRLFLQNKNDSAIALMQKEKLSPFGYIWKIPLIYKNLDTGNEYTLWLNEANATFQIDAANDNLLKFNPGFKVYYIVKYDEDDYQRIAELLQKNHTAFSVVDRFNLLHDAFLLAKSDRLPFDTFLEFSKYLKKEKDYLPWKILGKSFDFFLKRIDGKSETVKLLKEYVRYLTADLYDEIVSIRNDTKHFQLMHDLDSCPFFADPEFVEAVANLACKSENEKCIQVMDNELQSWIQRNNITIRLKLVFRIAIPHIRNNTLWDVLFERIAETNDTYDRGVILDGLAAFTGREEIMKTIDAIMQNSSLDSNEANKLFVSLRENPIALPILWNYTKSNWKSLLKRLDAKYYKISRFCDVFKTLDDLEDFMEFVRSVPELQEQLKEQAEQCVAYRIQDSVNWIEKQDRTIQNWLRQNMT